MVAFLRRFPCLDSAEYRRLARGETAPGGEAAPPPDSPGPETSPHAITANCARCYSVNGLGRGLGAFPKLAGQRATYLDLSLRAYARGQRHSGIMQPPCRSTQPGGDARAGALLRKHAGAGGIPAAGGIGNRARQNDRAARHPVSTRPRLRRLSRGPGSAARNPVYPELAGQYADYLALQLDLFKHARRGGTAYAHIMLQVAAGLTAEQMREVALFYASLTSTTGAGSRSQ